MGKLIWILVLIGAGFLAWYGRHDLARMFGGGDETAQVDDGEKVDDRLREQAKNAVYGGPNDPYFHVDMNCRNRKGGTNSRVDRQKAELSGLLPCPRCAK